MVFSATPLASQRPASAGATRPPATLRTHVLHHDVPVEAALVRSGRVGVPTDARGWATLRLAPGAHRIIVARIGFEPDTVALTLASGQDTSITVQLVPHTTELESVIVSAMRAERRVEDTPLRVEVVDKEEVDEKVAMTPGDVSMLLNETSGLRVQTTSPTLGGAGVRVQGLRGRYTLLLADGLPLYGGQSGGLGLLQIPPVDLGRVEVIKGGASALYGSNALGGVVNFISRRSAGGTTREFLLNQTSRGGTDAVLFAGAPLAAKSPWSATVLASAHRQRETDVDGDHWADIPGYRRGVLRPRLFFDDGRGRSLFATAGFTSEDREGGTMGRATRSGDGAYAEGLRTRRADAGVAGRMLLGGRDVLSVRASATKQRHAHQFGAVAEHDTHYTAFSELSVAATRGPMTYVAGTAVLAERYRNTDVRGFDYDHSVPSLFAQGDIDATSWLVLSASGRVDWHNVYGTIVSPRASLLLRRGEQGRFADWTARASFGGGAFAPTPFTEETEATGLTPLRHLGSLTTERAVGGSFDVGGPVETGVGRFEVNASLFASRLVDAVVARGLADTTATGARRIELVNAPRATRTWGGELLLRVLHDPVRLTATYAFTTASEWDETLGGGARRDVPLIPRHTAGLVASLEREGAHRIGLELYYTGRQALKDNPYRSASQSYLVFGLLAERVVATRYGSARLFLNAENLLDVRQTRVDPLLLPTPGMGGRRTTDVWSLLDGRTLNAGVRLSHGKPAR
jgi:iron complex outermembrane receptor protein